MKIWGESIDKRLLNGILSSASAVYLRIVGDSLISVVPFFP